MKLMVVSYAQKWIHAQCAFPNASCEDLKILVKCNAGFDIKSSSCKRKSEAVIDQLAHDVLDIKKKLCQVTTSIDSIDTNMKAGTPSELFKSRPALSTNINKNQTQNDTNSAEKSPSIKLALLLKPIGNASSYTETWTEVVKKKLPK